MKEVRDIITQEVLGRIEDDAVFSLDGRKVAEVRGGQVFGLDGRPLGFIRELDDPTEHGGIPPDLKRLLSTRP